MNRIVSSTLRVLTFAFAVLAVAQLDVVAGLLPAGVRAITESAIVTDSAFPGAALGMLLNIGQPLTIDQLIAARAAPTGGYEVYQAPVYDTVTWPAAGVAAGGTLDVFTTQSNDETVTNLKQPGTIPKPDKFHSRKIFLTPLIELTMGAHQTAVGRIRDLERVIYVSRSFLKLTPSTTNRTRQPIPLEMIGAAGGVDAQGFGVDNEAAVADEAGTRQRAQLSRHGGYPFDIVLDSNEEIRGQFKAGVLSALTAAMDIRVTLWGYRYQKVG